MDARNKLSEPQQLGEGIGAEGTTIYLVVLSSVRKALVLGAFVVLPMAATAQTPGPTSITGSAAPLGTTTATLSEQFKIVLASTPLRLRYRDVFQGSEIVTLDGAPLVKAADYAIDYISGTIRIIRPVNAGQVLKVTYAYSVTQPGFGSSSDIMGGGLTKTALIGSRSNMGMDLGGDNHLDDSLNANLYGWNNNVQLGRVASTGLMLFSTKKNSSTSFTSSTAGAANTGQLTNDTQFILQKLSTKIGSGSISFDYQDISPNFSAFDSVRAAGFDAATVSQLQKETGIKRMGLSMKDVAVGGFKLTNDVHTVSDSGGTIDWKKFGIESGGCKLDFSSQHVGIGFNRFSDLADGNRATPVTHPCPDRPSPTAT